MLPLKYSTSSLEQCLRIRRVAAVLLELAAVAICSSRYVNFHSVVVGLCFGVAAAVHASGEHCRSTIVHCCVSHSAGSDSKQEHAL